MAYALKYLAPHSYKSLPIALSALSAGEPAEAADDYELIDLNDLFTGGKEGFAIFPVTGDSMVDEILPGYLVIVDTFAVPCSGDIVASCVNGRLNIKTLEKNPQGLFLVPKNKKYKPHKVTEKDNFQIIGVVVGHCALHGRR